MNRRIISWGYIVFLFFNGCSGSVQESSDTNQYKIPTVIVEKTGNYIMARTGSDFFSRNFRYDNERSEIDSPFYHVSYRFTIADQPLIDEIVTITTDNDGNLIGAKNIAGIPDCSRDSMLCKFIINEVGAKEIALKNGLSKGISDWGTDFTWDNKYGKYIWQVRSFKSGGRIEGGGFRGNGEQIVIDPATGVVLDKSDWFIR